MKVPCIPRERIEEKASDLIVEYQAMIGELVQPPIPVLDICEDLLKVKIGFLDFEKSLNMRGVLGATYVKSRLICINERLLDAGSEGRMSFTCAHEAGHWVLHRQFVKMARRPGLDSEAIICRQINAKKSIERQANFFAACLLMPEKEIRSAFERVCGAKPLVIYNEKSSFRGTSVCFDPSVENWPRIAKAVCEAGGFSNVSKQAMIIRLQELDLLVNLSPTEIGWQQAHVSS